MAEADADAKLVLKPGAITMYLSNFSQSADFETFFYHDLILSNRRGETLAKTMEEVNKIAFV